MPEVSIDGLVQWDYISGMSLPHMSFILRHFLPMAHSNIDRSILQQAAEKSYTGDFAHVLASGSSSEGLSLPAFMIKNAGGQLSRMTQSDVDLMMVGYKKPVGEDLEAASYLIRTERTHPGYTLLEIVRPQDTSEEIKTTLTNPSLYYLDAYKCTAVVKDGLGLEPGVEVIVQGPAVTSIYEPDGDFMKKLPLEMECDVVHGLTVPKWPSAATEWAERQRKAYWPPKNVIEDIISKGCHVVGAGHAHSTHRNLEWRFSFSYAEVVLAANLTRVQKQCYLLLKTLHLCAFKQPKGIVSYHLKMLFFWAVEEVPQDMWNEDTVASMLIYLLDKLLYCLVHHNLPSYFIPSNNLIDAVPAEVINVIKTKVAKVRQDPINMLLKFNKTHKYYFGPLYSDMDEVMKPVIKDIPHANLLKESFMGCFMPVAMRLARVHLEEYMMLLKEAKEKTTLPEEHDRYTLPFDHVIDIYIDIARMARAIIFHHVHPSEILMSFVAKVEDKDILLNLLKNILRRFPEAPNASEIKKRIDQPL